MSRARLALLAASALAAASGCGSDAGSASGPQLRLPSAIAVFRGVSLHDPANLVPYLAIANAGRNDLTLVDARTDTIVEAPVRLRPLAVPFPDRPALLVSADLGDGMADLLVGVSAGDSTLQLVRTWAPDNAVLDGEPGETDETVELAGEDVIALAALPGQPPGSARIVLALAGGRLGLVDYARSGEGIAKGAAVVQDVGFEALALATVPGDGARVYAATLDPIGPGAVRGVAEIDLSAPAGPWPVRGLDARGPTRLVAAARLAERKPDALEQTEAAFAGQPVVTRVYAVLDESGCGPRRRIDCGIVALDPAKTPAAGDDHIPDDDWAQASGAGWMPYRAPIRFEGVRPLVFAVAAPPAVLPPDATFPAGFMRVQLDADSPLVTTAVGVVATDFGALQFLDLGRFRLVSTTSLPIAAEVRASVPSFVQTGDAQNSVRSRIWIWDPSKQPAAGFAADAAAAAKAVAITPGYTPSAFWTVKYQGALPGLEDRAAEAGRDGTDLWLAVQVGEGPRGAHVTSQQARLYHPALGVAAGDVVVIRNRDGAGNPICTLTPPAGTTAEQVNLSFELTVAVDGLLPPTADRPGGAVKLERPSAAGEWQACFDALEALAVAAEGSSELVPRLLVTFRSGGLLLLRNVSEYAGRPELDTDYVLEYRDAAGLDEDGLAAACPLADWDGVFQPLAPPPACDSTCRVSCEALVKARLARRLHHLAESCDVTPGTPDAACQARYLDPVPAATFPFLNGPAVKFRVGFEREGGGVATPSRLPTLTFQTLGGANLLADSPDGTTVQPNGALPFDRSTHDPAAGYSFYVSYPGNQVVDVTPMVSPLVRTALR